MEERELLSRCRYKIVCGTNLMTSYYERFSNWKMPEDLKGYKDILTLGVGWGSYADIISRTSRFVYRSVLSGEGLHSVRDSYTEEKFRRMGIRNVVNTGCPTLWKLTKDHCAGIPRKKASRVITAVTDYDPDPATDGKMLKLLKECYEEVFVWIQGSGDMAYLEKLEETEGLTVVREGVDAFTRVLDAGDIDYVGTRLHAGIHALNRGVRSVILGIDNRALEMGRDFHLPVLPRREDTGPLREMIESPLPSEIVIPEEEIQRWKEQFKERD
jgi:polysaccharide pyruvyl transferase WcaK-like protein